MESYPNYKEKSDCGTSQTFVVSTRHFSQEKKVLSPFVLKCATGSWEYLGWSPSRRFQPTFTAGLQQREGDVSLAQRSRFPSRQSRWDRGTRTAPFSRGRHRLRHFGCELTAKTSAASVARDRIIGRDGNGSAEEEKSCWPCSMRLRRGKLVEELSEKHNSDPQEDKRRRRGRRDRAGGGGGHGGSAR